MNISKGSRLIGKTVFTAAVSLGLSTSAAAAALEFNLHGSGISGSISLTVIPNPNSGPLPGTSPNPVDPVGSYVVTGITGTFSDSNIGLTNAAITGIILSDPSSPEPTNLLAPASFGFYPVGAGLPSPAGLAPGLSYDDLFYPAGSPQTASSYPFHGGVFDIYGIVFTLAGRDAVNLWSNGNRGSGVTYGVGVTDGSTLLDRRGSVAVTAVPEPATWTMMIVGFAVIGAARRRTRRRAAMTRKVHAHASIFNGLL